MLLNEKTGIQYFEVPQVMDFNPGAAELSDFLNPTVDVDFTPILPVAHYVDTPPPAAPGAIGGGPGGGPGGMPDLPPIFNPGDMVAAEGAQQFNFNLGGALQRFELNWWPLPYAAAHPFWVRFMLVPNDEQNCYRLFLAVDTQVSNAGDGVHIMAAERDVPLTPAPHLHSFWIGDEGNLSPVRTFINNVAAQNAPPAAGLLAPFPDAHHARYPYTVWLCHYVALVEVVSRFLQYNGHTITIQSAEMAGAPVSVDLSLDLGNTRSCMLALENTGGNLHYYPITIRDRVRPDLMDKEPFDSRIVFSRGPRGIGGVPFENLGFEELSICRIGPEADRAENELDSHHLEMSNMSSPKRYLWDYVPTDAPWSFADEELDLGGLRAISSALLMYMNPAEDSYSLPGIVGVSNPPNTCFPRNAALIFMLVELITIAYRRLNSIEHRNHAAAPGVVNNPRFVSSILLTCPASMNPDEQEWLRNGVRKAVSLWAAYEYDPVRFADRDYVEAFMGPKPPVPVPVVKMQMDEASALQLSYIYVRLLGTWQNHGNEFFQELGRKRSGQPCLRIASLDIGGGTTDMAVMDFLQQPAVGATHINYRKKFAYGLPKGGDHILKKFMQDIILPQLFAQVGALGAFFNNFFLVEHPAGGAPAIMLRKEITSQLWRPFLRAVWQDLEAGNKHRGLALTGLNFPVPTQLFTRLDTLKAGAGTMLQNAVFNLHPSDLEAVISDVLDGPLDIFAKTASLFDCDLLILGGRISSHPKILRDLRRMCPVSPDVIIPLNGLTVDPNRYPFASYIDGSFKIGDAKTAVVMGAAIAAHSNYGLFTLTRDPGVDAGLASVQPPVVGPVFPLTGFLGNPIFPNQTGGHIRINFGGEMWVGEKRISNTFAPATPFNRLLIHSGFQKMIDHNQVNLNFPIEFDLVRGADPYKWNITNVQGTFTEKGSAMKLPLTPAHIWSKPQSNFDDTFWLDSGAFN